MLTEQSWNSNANAIQDLNGLTTFSNFLLLPIDQQIESQFIYELPDNIIQSTPEGKTYNLQIFKQAGTNAEMVTVNIILPPQVKIISIQPSPKTVDENNVHFEFEMDTDKFITLQFE
jgi:hypothetical protein